MSSYNIAETFDKHMARDVDGYFYFLPETSMGVLSAHVLRQIADRLDERNAPWDKIVKEGVGKFLEREDQKITAYDDLKHPYKCECGKINPLSLNEIRDKVVRCVYCTRILMDHTGF